MTACDPSSATEALTFDAAGQRATGTDRTGPSPVTTDYHQDAAGELTGTTVGTTTTGSYGYDPSGQQTTATTAAGTTTSAWNLDGTQSSTTVTPTGATSGTTTTYTTDADGNRVKATTGTATADSEWDPVTGTLTGATAGTATTGVAYGADGTPLTATTGTTTTGLVSDRLGSVVAGITGTGTLAASTDYTPWGGTRAPPAGVTAPALGTVSPVGFAGDPTDPATGNPFLRARTLDPTTGAFTSTDPLDGTADPQPAGLYAYGDDTPTVYADPTGQGVCLLLGLHRSDGSCEGSGIVGDYFSAQADAAVNFGRGASFGQVDKLDDYLSPGSSSTVDGTGVAARLAQVSGALASVTVGGAGVSAAVESGAAARLAAAAAGGASELASRAFRYAGQDERGVDLGGLFSKSGADDVTLYHGTSPATAIDFLNGMDLDQVAAATAKTDGPPGFFLATDPGDAEFFATRTGQGAVLRYTFSRAAFTGLRESGATLRPIFSDFPRTPMFAGKELVVHDDLFETFNQLRREGEISVVPNS